MKRDANGLFEKYKAQIVVKGYAQETGLDFEETFAPIIWIESVRVIFIIAAAKDLIIIHINYKNV